MINKAFTELKKKQLKFEKIQGVLDDIESTIIGFSELKELSLKTTHVKDKFGVINIDYFNRTIRVQFKNNFETGKIEFLLKELQPNKIEYSYKSIVTVTCDKLSNVECEQIIKGKQRYEDIHFNILNYIIEKSCS